MDSCRTDGQYQHLGGCSGRQLGASLFQYRWTGSNPSHLPRETLCAYAAVTDACLWPSNLGRLTKGQLLTIQDICDASATGIFGVYQAQRRPSRKEISRPTALPLDAILYARLLSDKDDRLLLLTDASGIYPTEF